MRKAWDWLDPPKVAGGWIEPLEEVVPFVERLRADGARRIYDLGCGRGRHTLMLARQGFEVCATDLSLQGLRLTKEWLRREQLDAVVARADMVAAPYPAALFEGVLAVDVVYHGTEADVTQTIAEIARVMKAGGLAFITFQSIRSSKFGRGRRVGDNVYVPESGYEEGIPHFFADEGYLKGLIRGPLELLRLTHKEEIGDENGSRERRCHWLAWAGRR